MWYSHLKFGDCQWNSCTVPLKLRFLSSWLGCWWNWKVIRRSVVFFPQDGCYVKVLRSILVYSSLSTLICVYNAYICTYIYMWVYIYTYECICVVCIYIYTYYLQIYLDIFIHITCKQWLLRIAPVVFRKVCSKSLLPCLRLGPIVTLLHIPLKLEKQQRSVPLFKISNWPSQPSRLQFPQLRGEFATQAVVEKGQMFQVLKFWKLHRDCASQVILIQGQESSVTR
jgi:hypothetical protein